jgi:hypothetical protein
LGLTDHLGLIGLAGEYYHPLDTMMNYVDGVEPVLFREQINGPKKTRVR